MKKRILSIVMMLALALSLVIGTAIMSSAEEGDCLGASANLADSITMQVKFEITKDTAVAATATIGGGDPVEVSFEEGDGDSTVTVFVDVPVKDIDKAVNVAVYYEDDITDPENIYCESGEFTVASYLAGLESDLKYSGIAAALLSYGSTAKKYFAGEALAAPASPDFTGYESELAPTGSVEGIVHYSCTLMLEEKTAIRYYFALDSGANIADYTFKVEGVEQEPKAAGALYYVEMTGITPLELADAFEVTVTDGTSTYSCRYAAMDYVQRAFTGTATDARKAISAEIYNYFVAAVTMPNYVKLNYEPNGGAIDAGEYTVDYLVGSSSAVLPTATKAGYAFAGWYFDTSCTEKANAQTLAAKSFDGSEVTLYANWVKVIHTAENVTSVKDPTQRLGDYLKDGGTITLSFTPSAWTGGNPQLTMWDASTTSSRENWLLQIFPDNSIKAIIPDGSDYTDVIGQLGDTFDIVMSCDFNAGTITFMFYVNGEYKVTTVRERGEDGRNIEYWNWSTTSPRYYSWNYFDQQNNVDTLVPGTQHTMTMYAGTYITDPQAAPPSAPVAEVVQESAQGDARNDARELDLPGVLEANDGYLTISFKTGGAMPTNNTDDADPCRFWVHDSNNNPYTGGGRMWIMVVYNDGTIKNLTAGGSISDKIGEWGDRIDIVMHIDAATNKTTFEFYANGTFKTSITYNDSELNAVQDRWNFTTQSQRYDLWRFVNYDGDDVTGSEHQVTIYAGKHVNG